MVTHKKRKTRNRQGTPKVGIFWVLGKRIFIHAAPLTQAPDYDDFKIHEAGHDSVWGRLQKLNPELRDLEYDEVPRGRVMYHAKTDEYFLLADRCILQNRRLVNEIRAKMILSHDNTTVDSDLHYRCPQCLNLGISDSGE